MTPLIGTTTWSTDSIDERERFSFWREMVCRNVFNISVQAPPKRFSASITARSQQTAEGMKNLAISTEPDRVASVDEHAGVAGNELDEIRLPADARLFEEAAEMCFDRCIGNTEISGNLPYAADIDDGTKHTKFSRGEFVGPADHL